MTASQLKPGWKMVKFGDVVRQCKESVDRDNNPFERYVEGGHMDSENIHIRRWGEFGADYVGPAFHRIFRNGQVLYGSRRTYLKKVAVADFDGITANTTFVCETKDQNTFMQELLPFLMLTDSFTEHSIRESKGSTNPYINWPDIAKYEFPLPPFDEQKRFAQTLWAADEAIEKYLATSSSLQQLRNSIWEGVFRSADTSWDTISTIARVGNGTTPSRKKNDFWDGGTVPWLSSGKIHDRIIQSADEYITPAALKKAKSSQFPAGSVLVAMIGQGKTRGTAAFLGIDACINQNMAAIVPAEKSDGKYVFYCLDQMYEKLRNWSHGSNQGALNCGLVEKFKIPLPPTKKRAEIGEISHHIETELIRVASHVEALRETLKRISTHFMGRTSRSSMIVAKEAAHV